MTYRNFEANYLISLVSAALGQRPSPGVVRATEWRELFYLAEYHDITNLAYYSLIGLYDQVPELWKNRFSKVFRKWVTIGEAQAKEVPMVTDALDEDMINFVLLKDWAMTRYYPQPDMRAVEDVEILIKPGDAKDVRYTMRDLGFHQESLSDPSILSFYKKSTYRIIFYTSLFEDNRKLSQYYKKVWKKVKSAVGFGSRYAFSVDDFYIYMVADICDKYADGEVDARSIIDLYLYRKKHEDEMDRSYIEMELGKLELLKMVEALESLSALWFGGYEGEETWQCKDVEEYIWSKGAYGRETSIKLLPMILDAKVWRIRDARKKKIINILRWFFPQFSRMSGRYLVLDKVKILLPFFWFFRWLSMLGFMIKLCLIRMRRFMTLKSHAMLTHEEDSEQEETIQNPR